MILNNNYKRLKQLQVVLIIISVFFILFSFVFNYFMKQNFVRELHQNLSQETALLSADINSYYSKYLSIANQLSQNTQVNDLVKEIHATDVVNEDSFNRVTGILEDIHNLNKPDAFAWVGINRINSIIYPDGYADLTDYYYADRPWYKGMIESPDKISVSDPYVEVADFTEVITLLRPILDDGEVIGNIGMDLSIEKIKEYISTFKVGERGKTLLLTEGGWVLSSESETTEIMSIDNPLYDIQDDIFSTESYSTELILNGEEVFFYSVPTAIDSWYLCSYVPKSEINQKTGFVKLMSGILILSALVIIIVIVVLIRVGSDHKVLYEMNNQLKDNEKILTQKNIEIHQNAKEMISQKEEAEAAYHQLSAYDEELRAQYNEIEAYTSQLEKLRKQFELAVAYTNSAVWEFDTEKRELSIPYGFKQNENNELEIDGNKKFSIDEMIYPEDRKLFWSALESHINGETDELKSQVRVYNPDGELEWWLVHGKGDLKKSQVISGMLMNISTLKEQENYISQLAYIDPLTELPNRRKFEERLTAILKLGGNGAVLLLDLDNFKEINDTLGHVYGDRLLKEISRRLRIFETDEIFISRFGGDEFLILFENITDTDAITILVSEIIGLVSEIIKIDDNDNEISMSIGITKYPEDDSSVDELIMNADVAMYHVKDNGKNNFVFYNAEMRAEIHEKSRIEKVLDQALREDGFRLLLQPKINPKTGRVESAEALLRIKKGEVMPNKFIPIAEMSHRIIDIGRWVLEEIVILIHQWKTENRFIRPISINFSPKQMMDRDFVQFYKSLLKEYDIDPKYIEFEITESIIIRDENETREFLTELKSLGSNISLDDFGTGYSSLSYLTYMPVDTIKLDKTLCDRFVDIKDINVIKSLVSLAHGLGLTVIAEGIETFMQVELLSRIDCDLIQGYYYSKPLSVEAYENIMDQVFD
jgi:diguanylate cyclase (GGDEF)-like protein